VQFLPVTQPGYLPLSPHPFAPFFVALGMLARLLEPCVERKAEAGTTRPTPMRELWT